MNMDPVQILSILKENHNDTQIPRQPEAPVVKEQEPDTFSKKAIAGMALAGGAAITTGTGVYHGCKAGVNKVINGIEKEISAFFSEQGKLFKGIPDKVKINLKYGTALLAGIAAGLLVFKDSDKDGKLDIIEAVQKFINPEQ